MISRFPSVKNRGTAYVVSLLLLLGIFPALSVSGTLAWTTANTYINLAPNESFTKSLGDNGVII